MTKKATERGLMLLTEGERRRIDAIERSMSKVVLECGIRSFYIAKNEAFNGANIGAVVNIFHVFNGSNEFNGFAPTRGLAFLDYTWQDFKGIRKRAIRNNHLFLYKHRAYFFVPHDQIPVFMNVEELATLWHFPSSSTVTPGLTRVPSRRAEAPINLPTGQ